MELAVNMPEQEPQVGQAERCHAEQESRQPRPGPPFDELVRLVEAFAPSGPPAHPHRNKRRGGQKDRPDASKYNPWRSIDVEAQARPDLVLLDWNMPVMNGLDMIRAMKAQPETAAIPVVVISTRTLCSSGNTASISGSAMTFTLFSWARILASMIFASVN